MTDETDHSQADSGRSAAQKEQADVRATSGPADDPDVFLVEYPDGSVEYEPATPKNQVLFGEGKYAEVQGTHAYDANGVPIELTADVASDDYVLRYDGVDVRVPSDTTDDVVEAVTSPLPGEALLDVYEDITEGQVRRSVVQAFEDRFPSDRVEQTADGWVVDETFIVTFEAENFLLDVDPTSPHGSSYDESKQAVYLDLNATEDRDVVAPDGEQYTLQPDEQVFLTTVEGLLYPEDYFGAELVDDIQQHKAESETVGDLVEDLAEQTEVTGYTDSKTGIHHGSTNHSFQKHDVEDLNVSDDVRDALWSNPYDHAAVHELLLRKQEFQNNPDVQIFTDGHDDDSDFKWDEIEKTSRNAPIPDEVRQKLDSMFA